MTTTALGGQDELTAAFEVDASVVPDGRLIPAELTILPDRAPIVVRAGTRQVGVLPGMYRAASIQWSWSASSGEIWPADEVTSPGQAIFMPPPTSEHVVLTAKAAIRLERPAGGGVETHTVNVARSIHLLTPVTGALLSGGIIDGYNIGEYLDPNDPEVRRRYGITSSVYEMYPDRFAVPEWFYRVTPEIKDMHIAEHQTLGLHVIDFPWKSLGMPQYIALDVNLVRKIEDLRALMVADGFQISEFKAIYGFRPPSFNLGKIDEEADTTLKVPFSQHQYGRALDLIIDEDGDLKLDDLNKDGKIDIYDAAVIMHYVNILDRQYRAEGRMEIVGGAGLYTHNDFLERSAAVGQTPYIHVDTRGYLGQGGTLVRWPSAWPDGTTIRWGQI